MIHVSSSCSQMKKSNSMHPDKFPSTCREHFVKKLRFIKETSAPWNSQSKR